MELRPCPFCGEPLRHKEDQFGLQICETAKSGPRFSVACYRCGCRTGFHETQVEAIEAWNTRSDYDRGYRDGAMEATPKRGTCKASKERSLDGKVRGWQCHGCGGAIIVAPSDENWPELPDFCPWCGSKVES